MSLFNSVFDAHKQKLESQQAAGLQGKAEAARPRDALRAGFLDFVETQARPLLQEVCKDATERGFHASVDDELSDQNAPWIQLKFSVPDAQGIDGNMSIFRITCNPDQGDIDQSAISLNMRMAPQKHKFRSIGELQRPVLEKDLQVFLEAALDLARKTARG